MIKILVDTPVSHMKTCQTPTRLNPEGREGTVAGYFAHWSSGERTCLDCRRAKAEHAAVYKRERAKRWGY